MRHILLYLFVTISLSVTGQPVQVQNDSTACLNSLSVMSEFARLGLYEEAYDSWKYCFDKCPSYSRNIYVTGPSILYAKIENASSANLRTGYIDTLLLLYDRRLQYFSQEGYVSARKAIDILKYRPSDYITAYELLKKSVNIEGTNSEPVSITGYMQVTAAMFKNGRISAEEAVSNYFKLMDIIYNGNSVPDAQKEAFANSITNIIAGSGAAGCESIASGVRNSNITVSPSVIPHLLALTEKAGCNDALLISEIASKPGANINDAAIALLLAEYFRNVKDWDNAAGYYLKAVEAGQSAEKLADIYYNLSFIELQRKNYPRSREMALKALDLNPTMGTAYISIGLAYAASADECGQSAYERAAVYWAAVDKFVRAREVDPGISQRADELISTYARYFPDGEMIFFSGNTEGSEYYVGCWINERTLIRSRD